MKIIIKDTSTTPATEQILCDGHVVAVNKSVGPSNLQTSGPMAGQISEFLRAANIKARGRGNKRTAISFSVTRECASAQAAEKLCLTHLRDCLRSDTLICLAEGTQGQLDKLTIANVHITDIGCAQVGLTVLINYSIVGGVLT